MRKSALNITWPKTFFTVKDILNEHPTAKEITIRFRINKAIEENDIAYIGKNPTSVGRPTIVFATYPVQESVLQKAADSGVVLDEAYEDKVVKVAKVSDRQTEEVDQVSEKSTEKVTQKSLS